jgi:GNAT superfamily N-acetyltransferase
VEKVYFDTQRWLIEKLFGWRGDEVERAKFNEFYDRNNTLIVSQDETDIGWLTVIRSEDALELQSIYLMADRQRTGIGTSLINSLRDKARQSGKRMTLSTAKENPALRLYRRLGFVPVREDRSKVYLEWSFESFAVRIASPAEYALLPDIERAADEIFDKVGVRNLPPPAEQGLYSDALLVLVAGTPPVGFVRIIELQGQPHLEQISVLPAHGNAGIGSALLATAIQQLRDRGYHAITLMTFEDVPWNAPFYRTRGFRTAAELTPALRWLLAREKQLSMEKFGRRVALVYDLQAGAPVDVLP